jgi:hypothetical protein
VSAESEHLIVVRTSRMSFDTHVHRTEVLGWCGVEQDTGVRVVPARRAVGEEAGIKVEERSG